MRFAGDCRAKRDYWTRRLVEQQHVLIGMRLLLPTVMRLLSLGVCGPLPSALGPVHGPRWRAFQKQGVGGKTARVTFGCKAYSGQGLLEHGQQLMHPIASWRLTQLKLQRVHR